MLNIKLGFECELCLMKYKILLFILILLLVVKIFKIGVLIVEFLVMLVE